MDEESEEAGFVVYGLDERYCYQARLLTLAVLTAAMPEDTNQRHGFLGGDPRYLKYSMEDCLHLTTERGQFHFLLNRISNWEAPVKQTDIEIGTESTRNERPSFTTTMAVAEVKSHRDSQPRDVLS